MAINVEASPWLRQMQSSELDVYGNHQEPHSALNVRNPDPGHVYYWARRHPGQVNRLVNLGYIVVDPQQGHTEKFGAELPPGAAAALGGYTPYKDVILMKIPVEKYAELKERQRANAEAALHSSDSAYLSRGLDVAEQLRTANPRGLPVYYAEPSHGIVHEGPDGAPR